MATHIIAVVTKYYGETSSAERAIARLQTRWQRFAFTSRALRMGLLGVRTGLMGAGASFVGMGLAIRSSLRSLESYSDRQAIIAANLASTGETQRALPRLLEMSDAAARRYGFGMAEAAEAMGLMVDTGVEVEEAMHWFGIATQFARAADVELNTAQRVLIDGMRQFNIQSDRGARILAAGLTIAGRRSSTSIEELNQAFRYASVEMSGLGYNAEEVIAALAGISAIGLRSTTAGTRMRAMIVQLLHPSRTLRRRVRELGVDDSQLNLILHDTQGNLRPLREGMLQLANFMHQFGTQAQQAEVAARLFNTRGLSVGIMMSQLHSRGQDWLQIQDDIMNPNILERMEDASRQRMKGFAGQMRLGRTATEELGIAFGEVLTTSIMGGKTGFGDWMTQLAMATRYTNVNQLATEEARQAYQALPEEVRQQGKELREGMQGIAILISEIGRAVLWISRRASEHPELARWAVLAAGAIAVISPLLGGLMSMLYNVGRVAIAVGPPVIAQFVSFARHIWGLITFSKYGFSLIIQWVYGTAAEWAMEWSSLQIGVREDWDATTRSIDEGLLGIGVWIRRLFPTLTNLWRFFSAIKELWDTISQNIGRREQERESWFAPGRVERRITRMDTGTKAERRVVAARMERREAIQRFATVGADRPIDELSRALREAGLQGSQLSDAMQQIESYQRSVSREQLVREQRTMFGGGIAGQGRFAAGEDVRQFAQQVVTTTSELQNYQASLRAEALRINRRTYPSELGVPARPVTGLSVAGAPPYEVGSTEIPRVESQIDMRLEIPVVINEREIARAVGRHQFTESERRGAPRTPGQLRRVRATGVP